MSTQKRSAETVDGRLKKLKWLCQSTFRNKITATKVTCQ